MIYAFFVRSSAEVDAETLIHLIEKSFAQMPFTYVAGASRERLHQMEDPKAIVGFLDFGLGRKEQPAILIKDQADTDIEPVVYGCDSGIWSLL